MSSVKLMAALGGNRVNGARNVSSPDIRDEPWRVKEDDDDDDEVVIVVVVVVVAVVTATPPLACDDDAAMASAPMERQKRNRDAARNMTRMAILGGRIVTHLTANGGAQVCVIVSRSGLAGSGRDCLVERVKRERERERESREKPAAGGHSSSYDRHMI